MAVGKLPKTVDVSAILLLLAKSCFNVILKIGEAQHTVFYS